MCNNLHFKRIANLSANILVREVCHPPTWHLTLCKGCGCFQTSLRDSVNPIHFLSQTNIVVVQGQERGKESGESKVRRQKRSDIVGQWQCSWIQPPSATSLKDPPSSRQPTRSPSTRWPSGRRCCALSSAGNGSRPPPRPSGPSPAGWGCRRPGNAENLHLEALIFSCNTGWPYTQYVL